MSKRLKTKIHFNRINMQRNDPRVWSAHTSKSCNQSEKIIVVKDGEVVLETIFNPGDKQPRAYMLAYGNVTLNNDGTTIITI